jgi:hypothetical protein
MNEEQRVEFQAKMREIAVEYGTSVKKAERNNDALAISKARSKATMAIGLLREEYGLEKPEHISKLLSELVE